MAEAECRRLSQELDGLRREGEREAAPNVGSLLLAELNVLKCNYQSIVQSRDEEQATARAVEMSLKEHYKLALK